MKPIEEMTDFELREAVAREVMGLAANRAKVVMRYTPDGRARGYEPDPHGAYLAVGDDECLPYESDIAAAFEVVEKMHARGCDVTMTHTREAGGMWGCEFNPYSGPDEGAEYTACAKTAPRAICLAALQAVRAK